MRRLYQGFGMEVLSTAEMERADRLTIAAGTPGFALMLSAGQAVAEAAMDLVGEGPIMVVAGGGNNGGDGFVAAAELAARGREVSVILLCERDSLQGDAASASRGWKYPVLPFNPQAIGKPRSEEHTSELQSRQYLVCRLLLEKKNPVHAEREGDVRAV